MKNVLAVEQIQEIKTADSDPALAPVLRGRWSPRAFAAREVDPQDLKLLFEAARWSASCFNEQPWRFLVAPKSDSVAYGKLLACLTPKNQLWAKAAPVLLLTTARRAFTHNGATNRFALHDAGLALAQIMVQATALGLSVHAMGGYDTEKARREFSIPEDYELGAAVAIGYQGDPGQLPPEMLVAETSPRQRKPLSELVFAGTWGRSA